MYSWRWANVLFILQAFPHPSARTYLTGWDLSLFSGLVVNVCSPKYACNGLCNLHCQFHLQTEIFWFCYIYQCLILFIYFFLNYIKQSLYFLTWMKGRKMRYKNDNNNFLGGSKDNIYFIYYYLEYSLSVERSLWVYVRLSNKT